VNLAQLASLLVTGWLVWTAVGLFRLSGRSPSALIGHSFWVELLALLCCGTILIAFELASGRALGWEALRSPLRTARIAVWLAPMAILLSRLSPLALVGALVFVIGTTHLLYSEWAEGTAKFAGWSRAFAYAASLAIQTTVVAVWMGAPRSAAALLCLSAALLTLLCLVASAKQVMKPAGWRDSLWRTALALILAVVLTVAGRVISTRGVTGNAAHQNEAARPNELVTTVYEPPPGSTGGTGISDKGYPGVILWPKVKATENKLVAPTPLSLSKPLTPIPRTSSSLPFSGQYWMFKAPQVAPPRGSYFRRASPLGLSFSTTDQEPLSMKALQKLAHPLDLECCREIQLTISNQDRYPGTIALELLLIDTRAPGQPVQSLGTREVLSRPSLEPMELSSIPVTEVLDFPVPPNARIRQFDELQVLFHRDRFRWDRSARISLERFSLVPP
jgi:hypothetical protein